jgi:glycolate oxidase
MDVPSAPRPGPAAVERARIALSRELGGSKVLVETDVCAAYARDDSPFEGPVPDAVVIAESRDDVTKTLAIAERCDVPVTPRAAGTGRVGGAVPAQGGIVLVTSRLARVVEIDRRELLAVVEPGVVTGEFQAMVEKEGLFYPPDPSSLDSCTLGGNAAANAGGPRAFKYGVTGDYVLGVEACLVGGRGVRVGRRTRKGVTGYDVTSLLVGSEGTLAVFTELVLRLVPKPPDVQTMLALYTGVEAAAAAVARVVAAGLVPRCLELLDETTLEAVRGAGVSVDTRAGAMLLVEVDGDGDALGSVMERVGEALGQGEGSIDVLVAQDAARRAELWAARRSMSLATRRLAKHKLSEDVVVPRTRVPELLARAREAAEREKVRSLAYGHAGDGNLHVNFLWDDDAERPRVERAIEALMRLTVALGGTISGEHGIGLAKLPYLPLEQSSELIGLQRELKRVFDPRGLLNPGKIFAPRGHRGC